MTDEKFIESLRKQVIKGNLRNYREIFDSTTTSPDKHWQTALDIYHQLPAEKRESFLGFIRLIIVNSTSHFLGIIDGSSYLNEDGDEIALLDRSTNKQLSPWLQDVFLEMEEQGDGQ